MAKRQTGVCMLGEKVANITVNSKLLSAVGTPNQNISFTLDTLGAKKIEIFPSLR